MSEPITAEQLAADFEAAKPSIRDAIRKVSGEIERENAEKQRRIDMFVAAALTGLLSDGWHSDDAIRESVDIARRVVEELDK